MAFLDRPKRDNPPGQPPPVLFWPTLDGIGTVDCRNLSTVVRRVVPCGWHRAGNSGMAVVFSIRVDQVDTNLIHVCAANEPRAGRSRGGSFLV